MRRHSAEPGYERLPLEKLFDDIANRSSRVRWQA